jgi:hypothetical protein
MRKLARLLKSTYGERKPVVMRAMPDGLLRGAELDQVVGAGGDKQMDGVQD